MRFSRSRRSSVLLVVAALVAWTAPGAAFSETATSPEAELSAAQVMDIVETEFPGVIDTRSAETDPATEEVEVGDVDADSSAGYTIPADPTEPIDDLDDSTSISLPEVESTNESAVVDSSVVHTDLYQSTSAIVTPTSDTSFEIYYLMRDSSAPTTFETDLDLGDGYSTKQKRSTASTCSTPRDSSP